MKLLSDDELREALANTMYSACYADVAEDKDGWFSKKSFDKTFKLIKSQQQAWGEYVIGKDDNGDIDTVVSDAVRNNLRDEQRKRNAGKELVEGEK